MPIKWKRDKRFRPDVVMQRIASIRTVTADGRASFSGIGLEECLPALHSMLDFPAAAKEFDQSTLVWRGIASVSGELTCDSFLYAVNTQLSKELSTPEEVYQVLTSASIDRSCLPTSVTMEGCRISFLASDYPTRFKSRSLAIGAQHVPVADSGSRYCRIIVTTAAKSPNGAVTLALRAIDLQRAMWCLMCNPTMEWIGHSWMPINVVRLGAIHTIHKRDGSLATQTVWFEPSHIETSPYKFDQPAAARRKVAWMLTRLAKSPIREVLADALLRYVRAFDETNQNTAFLRLWGAVEGLVSPGHADYDKFVRRCAFLFKDGAYHLQLLEHLREYRNRSVHAGDESDKAKTHCFQLQIYFSALIRFHIGRATEFRTLEEANAFLDLPADRGKLLSQQRLIRRAIGFINQPKAAKKVAT